MFASRYLQASAKHLNSILTGLVGSHSRRFITNSSRSAAATVGAHAKSQDLPHIEANRRARIELAAAYRGLEKLNLNEGVCNHLTGSSCSQWKWGSDVGYSLWATLE